MLYPSAFNRDNINFISTMSSKKTKDDIYSVTLAKAISDEMLLPSTVVVDYSSYYKVNLIPTVERIIYKMNDFFVVNAPKINEMAFKFYLFRLKTAFNPPICLMTDKENAIEEFMGVKDSIDLTQLCVVGEDIYTTMHLYNEFRSIVSKMKGEV